MISPVQSNYHEGSEEFEDWSLYCDKYSGCRIRTPLKVPIAIDGAKNGAISHVICAGDDGPSSERWVQPAAGRFVTAGRTRYCRVAE